MFKVFEEEEDDETTKALDIKVEKVLRDVAETSANIPDALNQLSQLIDRQIKEVQAKGKQVQYDKLADMLKELWKYIPDITAVLNNYTGTLSAYAQHRALVRQERIASKVLQENRNLTKVTAILAASTAVLAVATIILALHL